MDIDRVRILTGLAEAWGQWDAFADGLSDDDWATPSRCPGWTVQDNLAHITGTELMLDGRPMPDLEVSGDHIKHPMATNNEKWVESFRSGSGAAVLEAFREISAKRLGDLDAMSDDEFLAVGWTPVGEAPYGRFMHIRVYDAWLHLQDCREPLGMPGDESGLPAEMSIDEVGTSIGYIIGKKGGAPDGSRVEVTLTGPVERVMRVAVDGRATAVDELEGGPTATLAVSSTDFAALTGGRADPGPSLADGRVTIGGDEELAHQLAMNLAFTF